MLSKGPQDGASKNANLFKIYSKLKNLNPFPGERSLKIFECKTAGQK